MFYVTALISNNPIHVTHGFEAIQFLYGLVPNDPSIQDMPEIKYNRTYTREVDKPSLPPAPAEYDTWFAILLGKINNFKRRNPNQEEWYHKFFIPKASGGFREINAPIDELKELQREIVYQLSHVPGLRLPVVHAHDTAYAYVPKRSTKHALQEHQKNGSNWFLKLDIKDFFPSCTTEVVATQLLKIYPLCYMLPTQLLEILSVCTLHNALPQGAPTSPFLTNLLMLPIDKAISDYTYNLNRKRHIYTRYADDLLISAREEFDWREMQDKINSILSPYGFKIKQEKTRYGSKAGRNWNLGIMLNKDNNLTLGHKHKQRMRAAVFNFLKDAEAGNFWDIEQTQILIGQLSYLKSIEPNYTNYIIQHYEQKTGMNYKYTVKYILNP